jgi:hypothetical protein
MNTIEPFFEDTSYVFFCSCVLAFVGVVTFFFGFVNYCLALRFMSFPQLPDERLCIRAQKSEECIAGITNQGDF